MQRPTLLSLMGFNPFRKQRRSAADIWVVAITLVVIAAAITWGFLG